MYRFGLGLILVQFGFRVYLSFPELIIFTNYTASYKFTTTECHIASSLSAHLIGVLPLAFLAFTYCLELIFVKFTVQYLTPSRALIEIC